MTTTKQLERKWYEDYGKRMKPNNVRSGYFAGYRRALRDMGKGKENESPLKNASSERCSQSKKYPTIYKLLKEKTPERG